MIKAVIFDCFGVLVTEGWLAFKAEHFGRDNHLNQQATDLLAQADGGFISHDDFISAVAKLARVSISEVHEALDKNVANKLLFDYITELKPQYKIGMLSNAAANWLSELFTPQQLELFDATSLSYEAGAMKPDAIAYEKIADKLGFNPAECVLVDDQERHCTGARDAGMLAILYENFDQLKHDLDKLLADSES